MIGGEVEIDLDRPGRGFTGFGSARQVPVELIEQLHRPPSPTGSEPQDHYPVSGTRCIGVSIPGFGV